MKKPISAKRPAFPGLILSEERRHSSRGHMTLSHTPIVSQASLRKALSKLLRPCQRLSQERPGPGIIETTSEQGTKARNVLEGPLQLLRGDSHAQHVLQQIKILSISLCAGTGLIL